eukprot:5307774-Prymnesium_polylepis.1
MHPQPCICECVCVCVSRASRSDAVTPLHPGRWRSAHVAVTPARYCQVTTLAPPERSLSVCVRRRINNRALPFEDRGVSRFKNRPCATNAVALCGIPGFRL